MTCGHFAANQNGKWGRTYRCNSWGRPRTEWRRTDVDRRSLPPKTVPVDTPADPGRGADCGARRWSAPWCQSWREFCIYLEFLHFYTTELWFALDKKEKKWNGIEKMLHLYERPLWCISWGKVQVGRVEALLWCNSRDISFRKCRLVDRLGPTIRKCLPALAAFSSCN